MQVIERERFQSLFDILKQKGYTIIGPNIQGGAIVYDEIEQVDDLPVGWTDKQQEGVYRLRKREDGALFGYVVGPTSWKKYLFPSDLCLWQARGNNRQFIVTEQQDKSPRYAFLGVRACDMQAIMIHDRIFLQGEYRDPLYKSRREKSLIIAINCGQAAGTCFCTSMKTGPKVTNGFDIVMTEIIKSARHYFVLDSGSGKGEEIVRAIPSLQATKEEEEASECAVKNAVSMIERKLDTHRIKEFLYENQEHPQWDILDKRCLSCTNCTMSCPTCFCSTIEDVTDLKGKHAQRCRLWDSCFTMDFSYIHGGNVRVSTRSRYRQWMTHKLASWYDQFNTSGCVGCGRCITWCPVGIDITQEVCVMRESQSLRGVRTLNGERKS